MHHLNLWYVDYNLPTWLNEGLAEYYGIFSVTPDGRYKIGDVQLERLTSLTSEDWLPLEGLFQTLHGYPASMDRYRAGTNPKEQSFFYAQSWIIVHYLENTPRGMDKLKAFTKALTPDSDIAQTFETHFGQDLDSFLSALKNYASAGALSVKLVQPRRAQPDITPRVGTVTQRIFNQELYLLTSPVQDLIADAVRADLRAKLEASGGLPAHVYAGDALAAFRNFDYYAAQEHIETALSLDPNEPRYHVLGALIAFYDWQESYNDTIVGRVRATLKSAIKRAPDYLELRSMLIVTHDPDTDAVPQDVIASLDHLMSHNYPVMNPDNAPTLISALLVLKRYDEILNILDITETWSENSERRLRANRLRYDIEREKRRANR